MGEEAVLSKDVRHLHPEWFEHPTLLGYPKGARRQYRYGNLHIREYDDHVTVHEDRFDPRTEPLKHVVHEAPELLAGAACGALAGRYAYKRARDLTGSAATGGLVGLAVGAAAFVLGAYVADKLREV